MTREDAEQQLSVAKKRAIRMSAYRVGAQWMHTTETKEQTQSKYKVGIKDWFDNFSEQSLPRPYGPSWAKFAAPGDQQDDVWILRFSDPDCREQMWTGENAEQQAWEAWNRYAPSYNCWVFQLATLDRPKPMVTHDTR